MWVLKGKSRGGFRRTITVTRQQDCPNKAGNSPDTMKYRKCGFKASSFSRTRRKHVLPQNTATGNMLAVLMLSITTYLQGETFVFSPPYVTPLQSFQPNTRLSYLITCTVFMCQAVFSWKLTPELCLLPHSINHPRTWPGNDILLLEQPVAKKQTCACLITKQEPDQHTIKQLLENNGGNQLSLSRICGWMTFSDLFGSQNALMFLLSTKGVWCDTCRLG